MPDFLFPNKNSRADTKVLKKKNKADRKTIEQIFKSGRTIGSQNLTFRFLPRKNVSPTKISFLVPKSVSKKATERNALRRRGYSQLEKYGNLPVGLQGVFIFKKLQNDSTSLQNEIKNILNKID